MFRKKKAELVKSEPVKPTTEPKKDDSLPLPDVIYVTEQYKYYSLGCPITYELGVHETLTSAAQSKLKGRKVATYKLVEAKCYTLEPKEVPCDGS